MLFKHKNPQFDAVFRVGGRSYRFVQGKFETTDPVVIEALKKMVAVTPDKPIVEKVAEVAKEVAEVKEPEKKKKAKKK